MKVSEYLIAAKARIDTPRKWIQGEYGMTLDGRFVGPGELHQAVCYCSVGALRANFETNETGRQTYMDARLFLNKAMGKLSADPVTIPLFNDHSTHAQVMAAWDLAIEDAKKEEEANA